MSFPPQTTALEVYNLLKNRRFTQTFKPELDHIETVNDTTERLHFADGSIIQLVFADDTVLADFVNKSGYILDEKGDPIVNIPGLDPSKIEPETSKPPTTDQGTVTPVNPTPSPVPTPTPITTIDTAAIEKLLAKIAARLGLKL